MRARWRRASLGPLTTFNSVELLSKFNSQMGLLLENLALWHVIERVHGSWKTDDAY